MSSSYKSLPSALLILLLAVTARATSPVCVDSTQGYDTRQVQYFYNAFCEDLDIKSYTADQQVYGFPIMSLSFQPAQTSLCSVTDCLGGFKTLIGDCESSNNMVYGTGSMGSGCGTYNFTIGDSGINVSNSSTSSIASSSPSASGSGSAISSTVVAQFVSTSTISPPPSISTTTLTTSSTLTVSCTQTETLAAQSSSTVESAAVSSTYDAAASSSYSSSPSSQVQNTTFSSSPSTTLPDSAASSTVAAPTVTESSFSLTQPPYGWSNSTQNSTISTEFSAPSSTSSLLTYTTSSSARASPTFVLTSAAADAMKVSGALLALVAGVFVVFF